MPNFRGGLVGCGYFSKNHLHAWDMIEDVEITAVCDTQTEKAELDAQEFNIPRFYSDAETMLENEKLDFIDIVTQPDSHRPLVESAAKHKMDVLCQKPLAPAMEDAIHMVNVCRDAGIRFMVHENFRWQSPMRALKNSAMELGELFFGRIQFRSAFDVYSRQPYLAEDSRFIIYDLGVHLLDLARFYLGEVEHVYCQVGRVNPDIKGEDVATIMLKMKSAATCLVEVSYASKLEEELFPQTLIDLEGIHGSAHLGPNYELVLNRKAETIRNVVNPRMFAWSTPPAQSIQESVLAIQKHWVECLKEGKECETSGTDNLRTLELVFGAYESAETGVAYKTGKYD